MSQIKTGHLYLEVLKEQLQKQVEIDIFNFFCVTNLD